MGAHLRSQLLLETLCVPFCLDQKWLWDLGRFWNRETWGWTEGNPSKWLWKPSSLPGENLPVWVL